MHSINDKEETKAFTTPRVILSMYYLYLIIVAN